MSAAQRLRTVRVTVVVLEDGEEKRTLDVGYFAGQPYTVKIDTPDGVDARYEGLTSAGTTSPVDRQAVIDRITAYTEAAA